MPMNKKYMRCSPDLSLLEAAILLVGVGRKNLIVVDQNDKVLGTLSSSDILKRVINNKSFLNSDVVEDVMSRNYIFLREDCSREEIIKTFSKHSVFFIPIINKDGILKDMKFLTDYL